MPLQPIIWPLRAIPGQSIQVLQAALPVARKTNFLQPVLMRQKPRRLGGLVAPDVPINLPWNVVGLPSLTDSPIAWPRVVHELMPKPAISFKITGVTKDSAGAVLGSCTVNLFRTSDNAFMQTTTSDANGIYFFYGMGQQDHFEVSYKAGSPDVTGATLNTLRGN